MAPAIREGTLLKSVTFVSPQSGWAVGDNGKSLGLTGLIWVLLQSLLAFKSDPEKLIDRESKSLLRALKDLLTLPSLIGESDLRREFAVNLTDVVEALRP
ncbi:hypothetical protein JAO29_15555 [Edaphobacter sp. HDX4]|uniref:hypothetical protein n=1 Tax=Edaphobacter sp. HDX4 TaxID=2794064 RepID=UPI002FE5653D